MNPEIKSALLRVFPFLIALIFLVIAIHRNKISKSEIDLHKPASSKTYLLWITGFLIFIVGSEFALYQFKILEINPWNHTLIPSIIRIAGALVFAPIVEELIFRGVLLNFLKKIKLNIHMAIFSQAVIFVLLHNFAYDNTLSSHIGIIQSLTDAILYGYSRHLTKSIYTPITMHMLGNLVATAERFIL